MSDLEKIESELSRLEVGLEKTPGSPTEAGQEPKIRHDFTVTVSGYGTDPGEAWEDAIEAFYDAPGCYDNFCTDSTDVAD